MPAVHKLCKKQEVYSKKILSLERGSIMNFEYFTEEKETYYITPLIALSVSILLSGYHQVYSQSYVAVLIGLISPGSILSFGGCIWVLYSWKENAYNANRILEIILVAILMLPHCIFAVYALYSFVESGQIMQIMSDILIAITKNFIEIAAILGVLLLGFTQVARYIQSKKYYIPFKITYANTFDFVDVFTIGILLVGGGLVVPLLLNEYTFAANMDSSITTNYIYYTENYITNQSYLNVLGLSLLISCVIGFLMMPRAKAVWYKDIWTVPKTIWVILMISTLAFYADISTWVWGAILYSYGVLIIFVIYTILRILFDTERSNLKFSNAVAMTTTLDEEKQQLYLLAMKHNSKKWILLPCRLETKRSKKGIEEEYLYFEKGRFVVKYINELRIYIKNYKAILEDEASISEDTLKTVNKNCENCTKNFEK